MARFIFGVLFLLFSNTVFSLDRSIESRIVCSDEKSLKEMINIISDHDHNLINNLKFKLLKLEILNLGCQIIKIPTHKTIIKSDVYENNTGLFYVIGKFKFENIKQYFYFTEAVLPVKDWLIVKNCNLTYGINDKTCFFPKKCNIFSKYHFQNGGKRKAYLILPANCHRDLV